MVKHDEAALICDFAETYNIYDYKQLPPTRAALFACGLRENSRIKMNMSNQIVPLNSLILAGILDRLSVLVWMQTKDAQSGKNKPAMIVTELTATAAKKSYGMVTFHSGEDFEKMRKNLIKGGDI